MKMFHKISLTWRWMKPSHHTQKVYTYFQLVSLTLKKVWFSLHRVPCWLSWRLFLCHDWSRCLLASHLCKHISSHYLFFQGSSINFTFLSRLLNCDRGYISFNFYFIYFVRYQCFYILSIQKSELNNFKHDDYLVYFLQP